MGDRTIAEQKTRPWPEQGVPQGIDIDCEAFGLGGHGRLVWGEGDPEAPLMFLLDNPGARETSEGVPFVCGTRCTLRRAAGDANLETDCVYITYLLKCRPRRAYDREKARRVGLTYVETQIEAHKPEVLVIFGDVVTKAMTGDSDASVRTQRNTALRLFNVPTVVTYHRLAARRRPNLYTLLVEDLRRAEAMLQK
jgi:uracil-DNA glycosylase family 4